jgi:aminoglycoside phosphotransferase (APT) family kinase protein
MGLPWRRPHWQHATRGTIGAPVARAVRRSAAAPRRRSVTWRARASVQAIARWHFGNGVPGAHGGQRRCPADRRRAALRRRVASQCHPEACTREFRVLEEFGRWSFPAPRPLLLDQQGGPFGAPTVVMTRLPGRPLLRTPDIEDYVRQVATMLVQLHRVPSDRLDFLPDQVALLSNSLGKGKLADDPLEPGLRQAVLAAWPSVSAAPTRRTLVHGDYWLANLLWQRRRLIGVVDWEDACVGDPSVDVAICRGDLTLLFGQDAANAFLRHYEAAAGQRVNNLAFWDLLTCTLALPWVERWPASWRALGRSDLTVESARECFRGLARSALARGDLTANC